jgi:hypothetical protein
VLAGARHRALQSLQSRRSNLSYQSPARRGYPVAWGRRARADGTASDLSGFGPGHGWGGRFLQAVGQWRRHHAILGLNRQPDGKTFQTISSTTVSSSSCRIPGSGRQSTATCPDAFGRHPDFPDLSVHLSIFQREFRILPSASPAASEPA